MSSTDELIQNVIDTMDNAHSHRLQLTQQLESLIQAKQQVNTTTNSLISHIRYAVIHLELM